jgi:hypothetical protein
VSNPKSVVVSNQQSAQSQKIEKEYDVDSVLSLEKPNPFAADNNAPNSNQPTSVSITNNRVHAVTNDNKQHQEQEMPEDTHPLLITTFTGLDLVHELGSSRFSTTHIYKRHGGDPSALYVIKRYNPGDRRESSQEFVDLSHPSVIPILGVIPPGPGSGPVIITPYSPCGSRATK